MMMLKKVKKRTWYKVHALIKGLFIIDLDHIDPVNYTDVLQDSDHPIDCGHSNSLVFGNYLIINILTGAVVIAHDHINYKSSLLGDAAAIIFKSVDYLFTTHALLPLSVMPKIKYPLLVIRYSLRIQIPITGSLYRISQNT